MFWRSLGLILTIFVVLPAWAGEKRQLDAHEHGHGSLNIAIEGNRVALELIAPGADIVGFEHEATTKEQKSVVAKARSALEKPLGLFVLPQGAGCRVTEAKVALETEAEHDDHGKEHDKHETHKHKTHKHKTHKHETHKHETHKEKTHKEETHSEFHAEYVLTCASPKALVAIDFKYFERFPGAEELEVKLITDKGQSKYEVERGQPRLELKGIM